MTGARDTWLGGSVLALGAGVAVNSLLGPLGVGVVHYPVSEPVQDQTIGLEAFSLFAVAPLTMLVGVLALLRRPMAALLALGPAGYLAYMLVQYVVGPGYPTYPGVFPLHLALFVLSGAVILQAWSAPVRFDRPMTASARRAYAVVVFALAAFVLSRYAGVLTGFVHGTPIPVESRADPGMYWSIVLLDLGAVVPLAVATGIGLLRRASWAVKALCGVVGWFALVPSSVAAMAVAMSVRVDSPILTGQLVTLVVAAAMFAAVAVLLFRRLARRRIVQR